MSVQNSSLTSCSTDTLHSIAEEIREMKVRRHCGSCNCCGRRSRSGMSQQVLWYFAPLGARDRSFWSVAGTEPIA